VQAALRHLNHLYRGTFFFGLACGISIALTSLFLDERGYSKQDIGGLALFFASGLVLFALPVGAVIRRFSGKRTLTVMLIGYALCVGLFPFMPTFTSIAAIRFLDGVFSVGVWVSSETILLSRTDKAHKAHQTSLYAIWLASGYVVGPLLALGVTKFLTLGQAFLVAAGFEAIRATTATTPSPFRQGRDGLALGEGAGLIALVRSTVPAAAGASFFVRGFGAATDAAPVTSSTGVRGALIFTAPFITCTGNEKLPGLPGMSV